MNSLPAQTLANIPGVLGYYPHQSIIFVTFRHHRDDTHSRWALGPTLRIDIDSLDALPEVGEVLTAEHADVVLAFIIGRFPTQDSTTLDEITTTLAQATDTHIVPIDACWHATTITNNGTYQLRFEQTPSLTDRGLPTAGWRHGRIADIPTAQATQQLLADGDLPELTRDDCFTAFDKATTDPTTWRDRASNVANLAAQLAVDAQCCPSQFQAWFTTLETELIRLEQPLPTPPGPGADIIDTCAAMLSITRIRDAAINLLLDHDRAAHTLALEVARHFDAPIRTEALCVFALCALGRHNTPKALHALMVARAEQPNHTLTRYLLLAYQHELTENLIEKVRDGSTAAAAYYGLSIPGWHDTSAGRAATTGPNADNTITAT